MLPEQYRLHHRRDFSATVRGGRRCGRRDLVVHAISGTESEKNLISTTGPRFGLVVSKAVGPAVVRHRVARRLRHVAATLLEDLDSSTDVVIRALPGAAEASSQELARQLRSGLDRLNLLVPKGES